MAAGVFLSNFEQPYFVKKKKKMIKVVDYDSMTSRASNLFFKFIDECTPLSFHSN